MAQQRSRPRNGPFELGEVVPGTRYRVLGLVGVGGMGSVYEVEHLELGKRFVLKALLRELSGREDLVQRLRNEQRALGRLEHPNIVAVTDAGVTRENVPYFVMERLEGETLAQRVKRLGRLSAPEALAIGAGVLDGLSAAHEIGVVHRDIKPPNILLVAGLRPKILDFGVAKVEASANLITARGVAVGTPRYMSPEQASGEAVDGRSDLYAVGLLLFEAIAGTGPFDDARDANEMLLAHLSRPAPRLSAFAVGVTRELDELVSTLLAKEPRARPPTARTAAAALRAVARRYEGVRELEAPTPQANYVVTTRLFCIPLARDAAATRADAPRARRTDRLVADDEAATLAHGAPPDTAHDTWIDDRTAAVTPDSHRSEPSRTEFLFPSPVRVRPSGVDDPTRTRVPNTPHLGTFPLAPPGPPRVARRLLRLLLTATCALVFIAFCGYASLLVPRKPAAPKGLADRTAVD